MPLSAEEPEPGAIPPGADLIASGFVALDRALGGGLARGELLCLAGRPGVGRTSLALSVGRRIAGRSSPRLAVLYASLELSSEALRRRLLAASVGAPLVHAQRGYFPKEYLTSLTRASAALSRSSIYFFASRAMTFDVLRSYATTLTARLRAQGRGVQLGLLIVDPLPLLGIRGSPQPRHMIRDCSAVAGRLKALALEQNVPVLATCRASRNCDLRGREPRPMLADLRRLRLDATADRILLLSRSDMFAPLSEVYASRVVLEVFTMACHPRRSHSAALMFNRSTADMGDAASALV